ncbi:MAG: tripartite tricarboxylate transporter substrate binding protein [Proteobacteria bacterium]|nr:tripartite tricarboxylate transporter substrate binding protein [Burkholderiales bacterium]
MPFAPGGAADIVSRVITQRAAEILGTSIIVDNRGGASGIIGADAGAKAPADGYTVTLGGLSSHVLNFYLFDKLPYDPREQTHVALLTLVPNVFAVHPSLPVKNLKEYLALARARPGELTYASSGVGSSQHLNAVVLQQLTGVTLTHVPYRSGAPAIGDLLGGQVMSMFVTIPSGAPHMRAGRLRAIGIASGTRSTALPDVASIGETVKGYDMTTWYSLHAPPKTPPEIVARLNVAVNGALADPEVRRRLTDDGAILKPMSPDQFGAFFRSEFERWGPVIRKSGIKSEGS